jgi:hypothetical protein
MSKYRKYRGRRLVRGGLWRKFCAGPPHIYNSIKRVNPGQAKTRLLLIPVPSVPNDTYYYDMLQVLRRSDLLIEISIFPSIDGNLPPHDV